MNLVYNKGISDMPYGWTEKNKDTHRIYQTWKGMIERCYSNKYQERFPTYKGCYVCERWLKLSNFVEDISKIDNYELWLSDRNYQLDKDIKSNGTNKCYCLEQCMFITQKENTKQANKTRDYISITGENNYMFNKGYLVSGENNGMYGKKHSEKAKEKMKNNHYDCEGKNNPSATSVVQLTKNKEYVQVYDYAKLASIKTGTDLSGIIKCCKGKQKTAGGYIWMYKETYNLYQQLNDYSEIDKKLEYITNK